MTEGRNEVHRVAVKPPPFWVENPLLWFSQLESQFDLANVTVDQTKYSHVIANLSEKIAAEVHDVIATPPATNRYETLKQALIDRLSQSETKRMEKLLRTEELGDRSPSQLLRRLRTLGGTTISDDLLKSIWLSRLPADVQKILVVSEGNPDAVAKIADRLCELYPSSSHVFEASTQQQPPAATQDTAIAALQQQVCELTKRMDTMLTQQHRQSRSSSRRRSSQSRSSSRSPSADSICWYHRRFGPDARQCRAPCSQGNAPRSQ